MKNYKQEGDKMAYLNGTAAAIVAGDMVPMGFGIGVAVVDIAIGDVGSVAFEGVFVLPKAAVALAQGDKVYYDASAKKITSVSSGNLLCGFAFDAALSGDATVGVKLKDC